MPSSFFGLEIGRRALDTSQLALDIVSSNTANVGTPGYSRQMAVIQQTDPYAPPSMSAPMGGQLGTGDMVASVNRVRNSYLDSQYWTANGQGSALNGLRDTLSQVEALYNEPTSSGLGQQMMAFFSSFNDLAANPESTALRATVLQTGQSLASQFQSLSGALTQVQTSLTAQVGTTVSQINSLASQISGLNKQIGASIAAGQQPNDLMDRRGALLDQLSGLVNIQVSAVPDPATGKDTGEVNVNVGGFSLVQEGATTALPSTTEEPGTGLVTARGIQVPVSGGALYSMLQGSQQVAGYLSNLDTLASSLITNVNSIHQSGYGLDGSTGTLFFNPPPAGGKGAAASISLSQAVLNNPSAIAAATAPPAGQAVAPGNGANAEAIAALATTPVIGGESLDAYYNAGVTQIGTASQQYQAQATNQQSVISQIDGQRTSVSGVNLDEEMTNMLQFQRAYQAAAQVITSADSMMYTLISSIGAITSSTPA